MKLSFNDIARHRPRLVKRALKNERYTHDLAVAEDLTQIALQKAWRALPRTEFGPNGRGVSSWLNRILARVAADYARELAKYREAAFEELSSDEDHDPCTDFGIGVAMSTSRGVGGCRFHDAAKLQQYADAQDPADALDVKRALAALPEPQREAVELKAAGFSFFEIATELGCAPTAARERVRAARRKIAARLGPVRGLAA